MVTTVRPRPTHYDVLGLKPNATSDEIAKAFARETSVYRPQAFGGLTEACMAYNVLMDPAKRRAYDSSIGVAPAPEPAPAPTVSRPASSFPAPAYPARQTSVKTAQPSDPQLTPKPQAERIPAPPTPSFQRPTAEPAPRVASPAPKPQLPHPPEAEAKPRLSPQIGGDVPRYVPLDGRFDGDARPLDWKRVGIAAGAITAGACILGALAGWWSADAIAELPSADAAISIPLPPSEPATNVEVAQPVFGAGVAEATPEPSRRLTTTRKRVEREPIAPQFAAADATAVESQPERDELAPISDQPVAEAPIASASAASMPLPNRTISRTIEKIGYSCGGVASTSPVEGAGPGVFKVTCASGQSYQARPVNGRYRFKRWSGG